MSGSVKDAGTRELIDVKDTIVVIKVSDLARSREWYSLLFGETHPTAKVDPT